MASANSPLAEVEMGVRRWLDTGMDPQKLILGLPWCARAHDQQPVYIPLSTIAPLYATYRRRYGYLYPCTNDPSRDGVCTLEPTSFRGAPCSDAAGRQVCFGELQRMLQPEGNASEVVCHDAGLDQLQHARYARCADRNGTKQYQLWWDDASTLPAKYAIAARYGLRGVGFWNVDCLECEDAACRREAATMWRAVHDGLYPDRAELL